MQVFSVESSICRTTFNVLHSNGRLQTLFWNFEVYFWTQISKLFRFFDIEKNICNYKMVWLTKESKIDGLG
jgi:hypothetical protein